MRCPTLEQLEQFLNESLTELDVSAVAGHIDRCAECQVVLDALSHKRVLESDDAIEESLGKALTDSDEGAVVDLIDRLRGMPEETQVSPHLTPGGSVIADSTLELPGRLGNYELMKVVGEGATGRLYRAFDLQLERIVAVKTLKSELAAIPSARARFEREARACAALTHDHIVAVYQVDPGSDGNPPWLVMEFIAGGSLLERIRGEERADLRKCVEWIRQAATALQAAHESGIIHRDVKPSNLLIDAGSERLRVADFGLARLVEAEESLTAEGMIAGTPAYMSPEQIVNPTDVTGLTDIYSLGVVLYEALTGELPFRGTVRMVLNQVLHEDPIPPGRLNDRIPRDLENVCLKAMSRERPLRYQSAAAFAFDLERWLDDRPVLARPIGPLRKLWRWARKNPRLAAGSTLLFAVLAAGAVDWREILNTDLQSRLEKEQLRNVEQSAAAEDQRGAMLELAHDLLYEVHRDLAPSPATLNVRASLLKSTITGLNSILESAPPKSSQRADAVQAITAAHSQLGSTYLELNRDVDAAECLKSAEQLARERTGTVDSDAIPKDLPAVTVLTEILLHQSVLETRRSDATADESLRDEMLDQARAHCAEAVQWSQKLMNAAAQATVGEEDRSDWLKAGRRYCIAKQRLGDALERLGQANTAGTYYMDALETLTGLEATFADSMELQRDAGVLHLKLATLAVASQRDPLEQFQNAYERFRVVNQHAPSTAAQEDLAFTCGQLVSSLLGHEDYQAAATNAREECAVRRDLLNQAPHDDWRRRQFGECILRLGTIEGHRENWKNAAEAARQAASQFELLLQRNPPLLVDRVLQIEARLILSARDVALNLPIDYDDVASNERKLTALSKSAEDESDAELALRIEQLVQQCREMLQNQ